MTTPTREQVIEWMCEAEKGAMNYVDRAKRIATLARADLEAELESLRKDALRYRWLRCEHAINNPMAAVVWKRNYDRKESEWVNTADVNSLDQAIDAAMGVIKNG